MLSSSLGIFGHCTAFPTSRTRSHELLEVDIVDLSGNNSTDTASAAPVTYFATDLEIGGVNVTSTAP